MHTIKEIKCCDDPLSDVHDFREASRAVLFDENNLVPILHVKNGNYHTLPGGGIDPGETKEQALHREVLEEAGSHIDVLYELGKIIEYRIQKNKKRISYGYIGKVLKKEEPQFTEKEIDYGFTLLWLPLDEAIQKVSLDTNDEYTHFFVKERDLTLLKEAKKENWDHNKLK